MVTGELVLLLFYFNRNSQNLSSSSALDRYSYKAHTPPILPSPAEFTELTKNIPGKDP